MKVKELLARCKGCEDFTVKLSILKNYEGGFPNYKTGNIQYYIFDNHCIIGIDWNFKDESTFNELVSFSEGREDFELKMMIGNEWFNIVLEDIGYSDKIIFLGVD